MKFGTAYGQAQCTFLSLSQYCSVKDGEIVTEAGFDAELLAREASRMRVAIPEFLNTLEAFAIPFVARVADDDLGYQETSVAFCSAVKATLPALFEMRRMDYSGRYESTVKLFERWKNRIDTETLGRNLKKAAEEYRVAAAKQEKVDSLGTED
jgi:hypothetical protein